MCNCVAKHVCVERCFVKRYSFADRFCSGLVSGITASTVSTIYSQCKYFLVVTVLTLTM